ncbi:hypothetical protein ACTFRP_31130 [Bacillus cereus group sp. MYBK234-1]|uniref:hypothetical protein n=1 Tax=Bacillus cereus group TaxID=86661 RepID=UPI000B44AD09|nr:hypothetical protein [Bacillus toyonensis]MDA2526104.1 hypothetical protein [Bacillus cereus]MEC3436722.1 hypothetical protein [Bacillus cereus]MED3202197.1 hypothetical protein [Bacillus toyonensis]OTX16525.1 hypothetical protein BK712_00040 [Bacillus thuringiensis serovar seoulensis]
MNHTTNESVTHLTIKVKSTLGQMETYENFKFVSDSLKEEYENPKNSFLKVLSNFVLGIEKALLSHLLKRKADKRIVVQQMVDDFSKFDLEQQSQIITSISELENECMEFGDFMQFEDEVEVEPYFKNLHTVEI